MSWNCDARKRPARAIAAAVLAALTGGCAAEVGSDAWCKEMDVKPKGDWSANDAADYAKHCVLRLKPGQ